MRSRRCRSSWDVLQQCAPQKRSLDNNALGKPDAGKRAELRVAALNELSKRRRRQSRRHRLVSVGDELAGVTGERLSLAPVVFGDIDHEGRRRAIIDEVVADPVCVPRCVGGLVAAETTRESRGAQHVAPWHADWVCYYFIND